MKLFLLSTFAILSCLIQQDNKKLKGTYTVMFEKGKQQQSYQIVFSDSTYAKKMPDATVYKGAIRYEKYKAVLQKNDTEDPMEIDNREIGKDTIKFTTKSTRDLSMTVNRGKMIRIR